MCIRKHKSDDLLRQAIREGVKDGLESFKLFLTQYKKMMVKISETVDKLKQRKEK